jgi:DNA polymerase II small subunit
MDSSEILRFCIDRGMLVDKELLNFLGKNVDSETMKVVLERLKQVTSERVLTKKVISDNQEVLEKLSPSLTDKGKKCIEKLKINLGLSIEISKEISSENSLKKDFSKENSEIQYGEERGKFFSKVKIMEMPIFPNKKLGVPDFVNHYKKRFNDLKDILLEHSELKNLVSINKISGGRQGISVIGMVVDRRFTKNRNLLLDIEDFSGRMRVLINANKPELLKKAEDIVLDSVIGFSGSGNKEILFANEIVFPEAMLPERKRAFREECIAFIGDIHFGSKRFLQEDFESFIKYINGEVGNSEEALKIKYLFLVGDIVTGVGNYPNQEKDLKINDLEEQFSKLAELLKRFRKDLVIIISPGNHDGVRGMEPQPLFDETFAWPLYQLQNVILTTNPAMVNIGKEEGFSGFDVLTYHGFSYPYYAGNAPSLIGKGAMNSPEKIMEFLLKHRHLAPTHASTQFYPLEKDALLIRKIPDIFVSGHTHKSGIVYYNNILLVSVSSWESMTPYQEKFGNQPDHCKVPVFNLKTGSVQILDFEKNPEANKIVSEV